MGTINNDIIDKFLLGECSEEELQIINSYIKESKSNARQLFRTEELYLLGKMDHEIDEERIHKAQKKLYKRIEEENKKRKKVFRLYRAIQYAAIIIATILLGGGIYYFHGINENLLVVSTQNTIKNLTLPDGTKVWLNKQSLLKYPQEFSKTQRKVFLEGEAYFEVSKNKNKPFIVENEAMNVRVLGTIFNLKNEKSCNIAEATLIEGKIEVTSNSTKGNVVLYPGQRAELDKESGLLTVKQVDSLIDIDWHSDMIYFKKANIQEICQRLGNYYKKK